MDLVSTWVQRWARYAATESKRGCNQSSRSVMKSGKLPDVLHGVSGCEVNLHVRLAHSRRLAQRTRVPNPQVCRITREAGEPAVEIYCMSSDSNGPARSQSTDYVTDRIKK